jgi:hypothetical protein
MRRLHRWFWREGLDLTYQLGGLRLRRYPTLAEILSARTPEGQALGFLADEVAFRRMLTIQRSGRVVPVVGDLTGGRAMCGVASELRRRGLTLGALYLSNVEQYVFEYGSWSKWVATLRSLPCHPDAVLIRSFFENERGPVPDPPKTVVGQLARTVSVAARVYLRPGPLPPHQMNVVVHRLDSFLAREALRSYRGYREVVCDTELVAS